MRNIKNALTIINAKSTNKAYRKAKKAIKEKGKEIKVRSEIVKELMNVTIINQNPRWNIPHEANFKKDYCDAEFENILNGKDCHTRHPDVVYDKLNPDGTVENLFWGPEVREGMRKDSIKRVINELKKDNLSRRGIIDLNTRNPQSPTDFPCLAFCHFIIRDDALIVQLHTRSSDVDFGFPNDAYLFQKFQNYVAKKLDIDTGYFIYRAISLHEYLNNGEKK